MNARQLHLAALGLLGALVFPGAALAGGAVLVKNAWVRAPVPGQEVAGVYMEIVSDRPAALVAVESPAASSAEIHEMSTVGGVMKMRELKRLELPAGKIVKLSPGGNHLMLVGIKPLNRGDTVPLKLILEHKDKSRSSVEVTAVVKDAE